MTATGGIMKEIYRVTIHGRVLESVDLRRLLSRAVVEKKSMDSRFRLLVQHRARWQSALVGNPLPQHAIDAQGSM